MEMKTALVSGADRGFGYFIVKKLAEKGWRVFATKILPDYDLLDQLKAEYPEVYPVAADISRSEDIEKIRREIENISGKLDLLVSNAAHMGGPGASAVDGEAAIDFEMMEADFRTNSLAGIQLTDRLLPLLRKGSMKRLYFTSSEISSMRLQVRTGSTRYAMSKAALNMGVRMLFNSLRPEGFTFRLFQPGGMKRMLPDGTYAKTFSNVDPEVSAEAAVGQMLKDRPDEDRLVLIDYHGRELSF